MALLNKGIGGTLKENTITRASTAANVFSLLVSSSKQGTEISAYLEVKSHIIAWLQQNDYC